ncbi:MAG: hypothetical protein GEU73_09730 [Chloroflexi bacterium]|nr:hypothetical protein [Chloroflexota bacterium]
MTVMFVPVSNRLAPSAGRAVPSCPRVPEVVDRLLFDLGHHQLLIGAESNLSPGSSEAVVYTNRLTCIQLAG